ncbi:MAG: phosphoribosyl-AMP cyclohydrolase [Rhodothermales bacterium]|nr:phosphoribosyl-AMP cyclohydrolase [Rhodothermales bacterium]
MRADALLAQVKFNADGLVIAVAQDHATGEVLMLAYMNVATLRQTIETGVMTYWSRSRQKVWVKGESSGNTQSVREVSIDCDGDALLFKVDQRGAAACHTGRVSCFYRRLEDDALVVTSEPLFDPSTVYKQHE